MKHRFFIIFFIGHDTSNNKIVGNDIIETMNNKFINQLETSIYLKEKNILRTIVFTQILEVTEKDFKTYIK